MAEGVGQTVAGLAQPLPLLAFDLDFYLKTHHNQQQKEEMCGHPCLLRLSRLDLPAGFSIYGHKAEPIVYSAAPLTKFPMDRTIRF
jgi:hypothetical protein